MSKGNLPFGQWKIVEDNTKYDIVDYSETLLSFDSRCISEWIEGLKDEIPHGPEGKTSVTPEGDLYDTIMWTPNGDWIKPEGGLSVDFETPSLAWQMFLCAFDRYRSNRENLIYWRQKPVMKERVYSPRFKGYAVYARCFMKAI